MGRTAAVIWHASFSIVAAGLYFFFVLPRWPELMGQTSPTLGLVLRIVTGALIGLAALPVVFTLQRTKRPELSTPELALRLRTASIALHVLAGVLIIGTAVSEIWLSLDSFGPWLFGIYGAAAAIALACDPELLIADDVSAHRHRAGGADAAGFCAGPFHVGDDGGPVRPGGLVAEHLEQLLCGDGEIDGADKAERCAVDEVQLDAFALVGPGHG